MTSTHLLLQLFTLIATAPGEPQTRVGIVEDKWQINGKPTYPGSRVEGLLLNVRFVNAVAEDSKKPEFDAAKNTEEFIRSIQAYVDHGVRAFTLCLQGGSTGYEGTVNSAFSADGSLRPAYLARVRKVIEACDRHGVVAILGCYYQRQDQILTDETAVKNGVVNVAAWLRQCGFTNVVLEIANEFSHAGFDHAIIKSAKGQVELIELARKTHPKLLVSTSGLGNGKLPDEVCRASDFLLIHFNGTRTNEMAARITALRKYGKPIVCNEDAKLGADGSRALGTSIAEGISWGYMHEKLNQHLPPKFEGAKDDPIVYARMKALSLATVFPGKAWDQKKPDKIGLNEKQLKAFAEAIGGRGCVIRHGYLAYSWGDIDKPGDVASAAKPVYAHFLWKALAEKKISSLDEEVSKYEPKLNDLNKQLGFKDRSITWRHLATQTSCYGVTEKPGTAFDYSDQQMALFWDLLFTGAYGATPANVDMKFLTPGILDPLGFQDKATMLAFGAKDRAGRLAISPRDFARFGLLYLHEGNWNGKQLLPEDLARRAVRSPLPAALPRTQNKKAEMLPSQRSIGGGNNQTDHFGQYSFLWWTNVGPVKERLWPDLPEDCYAALGHGGKRGLLIVPSFDLVVSWNDSRIANRQMQNEALVLLARSIAGSEAGPKK